MKIEIDHENRFRIYPENDAEKIFLDNLKGKTLKCSRYQTGDAVLMQTEMFDDKDYHYTTQDSNGKIIHHRLSPADQYEAIQKHKEREEYFKGIGRGRYGFEI